MERLLKDAQAFSGVKYDIDNLGDVYEAIHVVQEEMGIAGTTALEAEKTISGSLNSMKSAFKNVLGKLALGENIGPSLDDLAKTMKIFFVDNLFPMVGTILKQLPSALKTFAKEMAPGLKQVGTDILENIFGEETTGVIVVMLDKTKELIKDGIGKLTDAFQFLKDKADILIPVLGGMVGAFVAFNIITGINKGIAFMQGLMVLLKGSTIAQTFAQGGLNAVMAANPIGVVVIAIGLLVAAGIALYKNWDTVKEHAVKFWNKIKEMKDNVVKYFTELKDKSIAKVVEMKDATIKWITDLKDKSVAKVVEMKDAVIKWFVDLKDKAIAAVKELLKRNIQFYGELVTGVINKVKEMYTAVVKWFTDLKTSAVDKVNQLKRDAVQKITDMKDNVVKGVKNMKKDVVTWFTNMKDDAIDRASDMIDYIKKMPGKMADGFRAGRNALKNAFVSVFNTVLRAVGNPINGIIKGANWVLGKFSAPKISLWDVPQYAKGTDGHLGGPALVNDQKGGTFREMIETPDGNRFIPKERNTFFSDMPKGTKVLPAMETKKVMAYKNGVGTWIKDKALGLWNWAKKPFDLVKNVLSDHIGFGKASGTTLAMGKGLVKTITSPMTDWVKNLFTKHEDPSGAGGAGGIGSSLMGGLGFSGFRKTSPFGFRRHPIFGVGRMHTGVDLAAPSGTNVFAQHGGKVLSSGWAGGYGKMVKIGQGIMQQLYAHLSQNIARTGSTVKRGQLIGKVGSTGNSTGPHLHYEVRKNGRPIHPGYADGTITNTPHLANIAEGNNLEAIIPMNKPKRAQELLSKVNNYMGLDGGVTIPITLELDGSTLVKKIIHITDEELEKLRVKKLRGGSYA